MTRLRLQIRYVVAMRLGTLPAGSTLLSSQILSAELSNKIQSRAILLAVKDWQLSTRHVDTM